MGVKGFVFSIEALLAAVFLFGILLIASDLGTLSYGHSQAPKILGNYADGTLSALEKSKALDDLFLYRNDLKIRNISDSMPDSICTQIEIYRTSLTPANLFYSYSTPSCKMGWGTPANLRYSTYINRTSRTNVDVFWVKAIHYAKE